jgi:hypothetical protein
MSITNTPGFSGKKPDIKQPGVETFQRSFPQEPGKFCTLFDSTTGAQLGMSRLDFAINTINHQPFITPIKLEGFAKFEPEMHISRFTKT